MKIKIEVDESVKETEVVIRAEKITDEVNHIVSRLSEQTPDVLIGFRDEVAHILDESKLVRIFSAAGKVFAQGEKDEFTLRLRLYEVEEKLNNALFVRISNSEIINLKKVKGFDLSFVGTICVTFTNGTSTYVSRRYVSKIKKVLGI
ncbi:LytTR family DNA-binding domain-containing protein [Anaerotignum sp.]|uniref:LytTR family DNA-binding domain-containing protein n=1 Tax=Anaerotignum sp. TaxID=2039241 RepID=UPI0028A59B3E|nr:LytTR family DNA-binding domain-containing protein [Anaerotignum sp.]